MISSTRLALSTIRTARKIRCRLYCAQAQPLEVPAPDGVEKTYPSHINEIVDKISQLTLLEVADLNTCLKGRLNIPDAPMGMHMGGAAAAPPPQEEEEVKQIQTLFAVKLEKFDDTKKITLIKEVKKQMEGMNLVQAKKFVESAPAVVKEDLTKEEAETLKKALETAGATILVE